MQAPHSETCGATAETASLPLADYSPHCTVVLDRSEPERARFRAFDSHAHLGRWLVAGEDWVAADLAGRCDGAWMTPDVEALIALLDAHNVAGCVNLDGRWGAELEANLDRYDRPYPDRFLTFCQLDWSLASAGDGFADPLVASLRHSAAAGARGLKVWKTLGLGFRDAAGSLLLPNDARAAPIFAAAGELDLPVLIHTADPRAFFAPVDARNERLEELLRHPEWSFARAGLPSHEGLMESFEALVAAHPQTTFIGAHMAGNVEDLGWVSRMLAKYPNLHVDIAARLSDLGRQPRAARRLFCEHPDRILFGTDELPPGAAGLRRYFRFLETADECYPYSDETPPLSGRWTISALELPGEVLRAIYADNARRVLGLAERTNDVEQT